MVVETTITGVETTIAGTVVGTAGNVAWVVASSSEGFKKAPALSMPDQDYIDGITINCLPCFFVQSSKLRTRCRPLDRTSRVTILRL